MDVARVAYCVRARSGDHCSSSRVGLADREVADRTMTAKNSLARQIRRYASLAKGDHPNWLRFH
jgi:hypothetical protein